MMGPLATLPVACMDAHGNTLRIGTGWLLMSADGPFLVTNYHVIDGGASLRVYHRTATGATFTPINEPLWLADGRRRWAQHKRLGSAIDVVALPVQEHSGIKLHALNPADFPDDLMVRPATSVTIVGYPKG